MEEFKENYYEPFYGSYYGQLGLNVEADKLTYEQYKDVMDNRDKYEDWYVGFVGFLCSFGSKFFGGYARGKANNGEPRNYAMESYRNLNKQAPNLKNIIFKCSDFRKIKGVKGFVIYCDPPYKGTKQFANSVKFDHEEFWDIMRDWSKRNIVLISEQEAPDDFVCIWEKEVARTIIPKAIPKSTEKLFIYKDNI